MKPRSTLTATQSCPDLPVKPARRLESFDAGMGLLRGFAAGRVKPFAGSKLK
jgi:hypothetical protein